MTCREIEDRLPAYLEDFLSSEEKESIEGHLTICSRCRQAVADLKKADELVRNLGEVEPPAFLEQRIMSRIREESGQKKGLLRRLFYPLHIKVPIQALASVLIAVIGFYVYQTGEPEMKQIVSPAPPFTEREKGGVAADSPKTVTGPSVGAQDKQVSVGSASEKKQQPLAVPPQKDGGKENRMADSSALMREEIPSVTKPAAMAEKAEGKVASPAGTGALKPERTEQQEAERTIDTHLSKQKRKETIAQADTAAGGSRKTAAPPERSRLMTAVAIDKPTINLTILVKDKGTAIREIEALLGQLNARIEEKGTRDEKEILKATIASQEFAAFLDRLETIGKLQWEKSPVAAPEEKVTVNITIVDNP
jgi:predicted anti-sigma-YlaC factor YlaD